MTISHYRTQGTDMAHFLRNVFETAVSFAIVGGMAWFVLNVQFPL